MAKPNAADLGAYFDFASYLGRLYAAVSADYLGQKQGAVPKFTAEQLGKSLDGLQKTFVTAFTPKVAESVVQDLVLPGLVTKITEDKVQVGDRVTVEVVSWYQDPSAPKIEQEGVVVVAPTRVSIPSVVNSALLFTPPATVTVAFGNETVVYVRDANTAQPDMWRRRDDILAADYRLSFTRLE